MSKFYLQSLHFYLQSRFFKRKNIKVISLSQTKKVMKNRKMKRLFVFVPAILLVLFLLNSFVLKEKKTIDKTKKGA